MPDREQLEAKLAEYRQAVKDHEAKVEEHRQLAILNQGAALAIEDVLKGAGEPAPQEEGKDEDQVSG